MADVLPLNRSACPCGWKVPVNINIFGLLFPPITFVFDCPECGRSFEKRGDKVAPFDETPTQG